MKHYFTRPSLKAAVPFWGLTVAGFYLLPLCIHDTGSGILVLLVILPVLCFGCALAYSIRQVPALWYVAGVPLLFMPSGFLFYGSDIEALLFYTVVYALIAMVGHAAGIGMRRIRP